MAHRLGDSRADPKEAVQRKRANADPLDSKARRYCLSEKCFEGSGEFGPLVFLGVQRDDVVMRDVVDQSVCIVDVAGPCARKNVPERICPRECA